MRLELENRRVQTFKKPQQKSCIRLQPQSGYHCCQKPLVSASAEGSFYTSLCIWAETSDLMAACLVQLALLKFNEFQKPNDFCSLVLQTLVKPNCGQKETSRSWEKWPRKSRNERPESRSGAYLLTPNCGSDRQSLETTPIAGKEGGEKDDMKSSFWYDSLECTCCQKCQ